MQPYQWFLLGVMAAWIPSVVLFALLVAQPLMIRKRASVAKSDMDRDGAKTLMDTRDARGNVGSPSLSGSL
jgi:hypothetical protein